MNEETVERELRQNDLYEELREMEDRKKEIYAEVGLSYYNLEVADVLNFVRGELNFVKGNMYSSYSQGQEYSLNGIITYIESNKEETNK